MKQLEIGPDLKQFSKQEESARIATKPAPVLLQSPCFSLFQKVVAFFGPRGLLHSYFMDLRFGQDCFKVVFGKLGVVFNV